ncbi:MAG: glycosyltransferase family 2 protein [Lachnospiraceae bacterium]|nr:glycosyltransferase family 2 protein [Lachnospiraceae bacterium]
MQYSVDVVLLTYKPKEQVLQLIDLLEKQTYPVEKIIIINTEEKYFRKIFYETGFMKKYNNLEVYHISEKEFDHGKTRNKAVKYSESDIFICMTQDAIPDNEFLVENLVKALMDKPDIAAAYARQLPLADCREIERYTREFNYPDKSCVKSIADIDRLGIKTFFCSNVCAAYNRKIFENQGKFICRTIFNEDMIYAGKAIKAGYRIAYCAEARVRHSHNYTCLQQLKRNFDLGVSQSDHPEVFADISSSSEGMRLVKDTIVHLWNTNNKRYIPYLIVSSAYKYIGYKLGLNYNKLPDKMIKKCTMNINYWRI